MLAIELFFMVERHARNCLTEPLNYRRNNPFPPVPLCIFTKWGFSVLSGMQKTGGLTLARGEIVITNAAIDCIRL